MKNYCCNHNITELCENNGVNEVLSFFFFWKKSSIIFVLRKKENRNFLQIFKQQLILLDFLLLFIFVKAVTL